MEDLNKNFMYKWFIITVIGGKEESICDALKEKMVNYGYWDQQVKEIRVFMIKKVDEQIFSKTDPSLPSSLKNTKSTKWEVLPDGRYKRIKTKNVNRFPSYIFVKMHWERDVWYAIRNTVGVLGFIGSAGKGTTPTPIHIQEFENILRKEINAEYSNRAINNKLDQQSIDTNQQQQNSDQTSKPKEETKKVNTKSPSNLTSIPYKIGNVVVIETGSFASTKATIVGINAQKGTVQIEFNFFGRANVTEISINDIKLADSL